jgi:acyl-coenzyme A synthetase/AMP-(fatty) acid ligase
MLCYDQHKVIDDRSFRGGENIGPAEIDDVLIEHPAVDRSQRVGRC